MKGLFIPEITAGMFRNGCLESIEALMAEGEIYDIDYPLEQQPCDDCISREDALNAVNSLTEIHDSDIVEKITTLNNIDWIKMKINEIPSVTPQQTRWIPIDDDLPEEDELVMVTMEKDGHRLTTTAVYYPSSLFWHDYVTAWMPYIEPYKAESEDKE